jgi:hypothetical protein
MMTFGMWMLDELRFGITLVYRQEYVIAVGWWMFLFAGETTRCVSEVLESVCALGSYCANGGM